MTNSSKKPPLAILVSGGLDSCVLLGEKIQTHSAIQPLYVRCGLYWEEAEHRSLCRFLEAMAAPNLRPLHVLHVPTDDLYGNHWSRTGLNVPDSRSADESVFLPGRNVLLLSKAILWCHLNEFPTVALAPLHSNPFPDATPEFFNAFQQVVNQAVGGNVEVIQPYLGLSKVEVMRRGRSFPLQWTFSCIRPVGDQPCGDCNKCAERQKAFVEADMPDPTNYGKRVNSSI